GSMRAAVVTGEGSVEEALRAVRELAPMEGRALAAVVSTREPYAWGEGERRSGVASVPGEGGGRWKAGPPPPSSPRASRTPGARATGRGSRCSTTAASAPFWPRSPPEGRARW